MLVFGGRGARLGFGFGLAAGDKTHASRSPAVQRVYRSVVLPLPSGRTPSTPPTGRAAGGGIARAHRPRATCQRPERGVAAFSLLDYALLRLVKRPQARGRISAFGACLR